MKFKNKALYSLLVGSTLLSVSGIKGNNSQRSDDIMSAAEPHKPSQTLQSEITSLRSTDSIFETVITGKGICLENGELSLNTGELIEKSLPYTVEKLLFADTTHLPSIGYKTSSPEDATFLAKEITKYQSTSDNVLSVDLTNNTIILKDRPETPLALIAVFNRAQQALKDENKFGEEDKIAFESLPFEQQPVIPLEDTFTFRTMSSITQTLQSIHATDREFFKQTGSNGWERNVGTIKMFALIAKTLETGKHHLTQDEMDYYATNQILVYLTKVKSDNLVKFTDFFSGYTPDKKFEEGIIRPDELYGFAQEQVDHILSKKIISRHKTEANKKLKTSYVNKVISFFKEIFH